jgi:CheY-like chemotaxis protein
LMDVQMPVMDGLRATSAIRQLEMKKGGHLPILAMTANALQSDREQCLKVGMDDFLTKPLRKELLRDALETWSQRFPAPQGRELAAPAGAFAGEPLLQAVLARLGGDRPLVREVVGLMLEDVPKKFEALRAAISENQLREIKVCAHSLKGVIANLDSDAIRAVLEDIENQVEMSPFSDKEQLMALCSRAELAWQQLERYLTDWLQPGARA